MKVTPDIVVAMQQTAARAYVSADDHAAVCRNPPFDHYIPKTQRIALDEAKRTQRRAAALYAGAQILRDQL